MGFLAGIETADLRVRPLVGPGFVLQVPEQTCQRGIGRWPVAPCGLI